MLVVDGIAVTSIVTSGVVALASPFFHVWNAGKDREHQRLLAAQAHEHERRQAAEERTWAAKEKALQRLMEWSLHVQALVEGRSDAKDAPRTVSTWSRVLRENLAAAVQMYASPEVCGLFARVREWVFDKLASLNDRAWEQLAQLRQELDAALGIDDIDRAAQLEMEMASILEGAGVMGDGGGPVERLYDELDRLRDAVRKDRSP